MFPINDILDAVLIGAFLFGVIFTVASLLLGFADLGLDSDTGDHGVSGDHGFAQLFNVSSVLAFITWFGGIGYALRNGFGWIWPIALVFAVIGGVAAAWLVGQFMHRILRSADEVMNPRDYERVGVLARVTSSIRPGGVGEIVWEQKGTRMVTSAKGSGDEPIPRGTEVLILRVEKGLAVVEPFEALLNQRESAGSVSG
jgi:membrane protein implicated in regulation of membrane protease activity